MNKYDTVPTSTETKESIPLAQLDSHVVECFEQEELLKKLDDIEVLIKYLKKEMNQHDGKEFFTDAMAEAFRTHGIDGYAFQLLEDEHLQEMEIDINLGQKLHLLSKSQKVSRAVRMKRRNRQIFKVKCTLFTGSKSYEGTVSLTNSCLKFKFVEQNTEIVDQMPTCSCWVFCNKFAKLKITGMVRALDHIDISLIEDVDFRSVDITRKSERKNAYCPGFCFCQHKEMPEEKIKCNFVSISLAVPEEIYSAYMGGGEKTTNLRVEIKDKDQAILFKDKLIDAMEEVQFEEGSRY